MTGPEKLKQRRCFVPWIEHLRNSEDFKEIVFKNTEELAYLLHRNSEVREIEVPNSSQLNLNPSENNAAPTTR